MLNEHGGADILVCLVPMCSSAGSDRGVPPAEADKNVRSTEVSESKIMTTLICPRCQQRLTVSELAPKRLTCPNCLGALVNPHWSQTPAPTISVHMQMQPRRVFSVDHQVQRDARGTGLVLAGVAVLFAAASFISFNIPQGWKIGTGLALLAVLCVVTIFLQWRYSPDEPAGQIAAAVGDVLMTLAGGFLKIALIILGVIALLFGACALIFSGSNWHGS
jgi:hypothetical protein